jgi:hypothetical protein
VFSQEELIALMQSNTLGSYQPSPNPLIYTEPLITVSGNLNSPVQFTIKGYGFTPDQEILILGVQVISLEVVNFFECVVTIQISAYGTFPINFYLNDQLISSYGITELTITSSLPSTNWIDYRTYRNFPVMSRLATAPTTNLANAGLQINSNGIFTTTSSGNNLFVIFPDMEVPPRAVYRYESITTFSSGSFGIWTGITRVPNWDNPRRSIVASNALENRAYSRAYYGFNSYYKSIDQITGVNWSGSFIHTVIDITRDLITLTAYGRSNLSYDWDNADDGEFIFSEQVTQTDELPECYPSVQFAAANSTSYLIAQKFG